MGERGNSKTTCSGDWRFCYPFFRKRDVNGDLLPFGPLMKRKLNGKTEYRRMTEEEERDYVADEAW